MLSYEIDFNQFSAGIKRLATKADEVKKLSAMDIGFEIMRKSQEQVPHDKGSLQNSGNVEPIGDDVVVGYHEPYAARLHEHPEYRFQKGRKGKYLEDPVIQLAPVLGFSFGKSFEAGLK